MAIRIGIAAALLLIALVVVAVVERRNRAGGGNSLGAGNSVGDESRFRGQKPFTADAGGVRQLVRSDFPRPDAPWLVVLFSSIDCGGCAEMAAKVAVLESDAVAVTECEFTSHRPLHERYAIDAVPLVVVADATGLVRRTFLGSATATDLWAAVAHARGSSADESGPVTELPGR